MEKETNDESTEESEELDEDVPEDERAEINVHQTLERSSSSGPSRSTVTDQHVNPTSSTHSTRRTEIPSQTQTSTASGGSNTGFQEQDTLSTRFTINPMNLLPLRREDRNTGRFGDVSSTEGNAGLLGSLQRSDRQNPNLRTDINYFSTSSSSSTDRGPARESTSILNTSSTSLFFKINS